MLFCGNISVWGLHVLRFVLGTLQVHIVNSIKIYAAFGHLNDDFDQYTLHSKSSILSARTIESFSKY